MKREEKTLWNVFFIICVFSNVVTAIVTFQDDEKDPPVLPVNETILEKSEENSDFSDNLTHDYLEQNSENANSEEKKVNEEISGQSIFAEVTSQNSGVLNDVTTGGTPLVVTLPEDVTLELKAKVEELSASVIASQLESHINQTKDIPQPSVDHAKLDEEVTKLEEPKNDTDIPQNKTSDAQEDIPSFSEWAQKRMQEAEKNGEVQNDSSHHQAASNGKSGSGVKLGWKNYAAPDCGAKIVAANPEAVSPKSVISPSREEYKLNVCTDRIWFIVELCEAIQAKKIDIANFELFSSTPKDFVVSIGDRFPSREWSIVGQFITQDVRDIQSFDLNPHLFGRYIKVEVKSHHGSQHYCPISLFRVYGISELEVLQKEELAQADEDDDDDDDTLNTLSDDQPKNMLNSATNAVFSIIKKAAEVLVTKSNDTVEKSDDKVTKSVYTPLINTCSTPSHRIVCVNCTDVLFGQIYELMSCKSVQIHNLIGVPYIRRSLINSNICTTFGMNFNELDDRSTFNGSSRSVQSFFSNKILGAMCNSLSVVENKAVLNISQQFSNETDSLDESDENLTDVEMSKVNLKVDHSIDNLIQESDNKHRQTEELHFVSTNNVDIPKATCSTDIAYSSQIKPTKTVSLNVLVDSSDIPLDGETEELPVQGSQTDIPLDESKADSDNERFTEPETKINETQQGIEVNANEEITTESTENIDQIESFMVDMNGENGAPTVQSVSTNSLHDRQKESVFLRLSNRIKALERNVSLSSQYLEELSRRYKKQVEELQKLLDKTLQSVTEERKRMDERNQQLEERLEQLMVMIGKWPSVIFWFFFTIAGTCGMLWICRSERATNRVKPEIIERRNSVDIIRPTEKKTKIRRSSDQALKIVRSSILPEERKLSKEKRKRKKSNKGMKRSNSVTGLESDDAKARVLQKSLSSMSKRSSQRTTPELVQNSPHDDHLSSSINTTDWVEENRRLLEVTILDESEHSSLEPFSTISDREFPQYTKTATDSRAHRMSSQFKPSVNGDHAFRANVPRKTGSLDESYSFGIDRRLSLNSKSEEGGRKKEKKSFRSVLKNVFT